MKPKNTKSDKASKTESAGSDAIASYAKAQPEAFDAICQTLQKEIDAALPKADSKIWHAIPVWFIGGNPVVGYKATTKYVNLLFWNGQSFKEPGLEPAGKFKAAQIKFMDVSEIDLKTLRRWLKKAKTDIWDYQGLRRGSGRASE
jgi:hypothetical protein